MSTCRTEQESHAVSRITVPGRGIFQDLPDRSEHHQRNRVEHRLASTTSAVCVNLFLRGADIAAVVTGTVGKTLHRESDHDPNCCRHSGRADEPQELEAADPRCRAESAGTVGAV